MRPRWAALAESNGLAVGAPLLGWTSWGYNQRTPTAAEDEADAAALASTGLKADGCANQKWLWSY